VKNEFHIPKGREVVFQFRSRDVIHSAFMPHFRAQMNCVPGQVTAFRFKPTISTAEMRKDPQVMRNIDEINAIRVKRGEDPIEFDYVLLCNKICGASHYNMQMKIVVDEPKDYEAWLAKQPAIKGAAKATAQK
jgi:cytochrome c oxidase subunit 2